MNFDLDPADEIFREEVRSFIRGALPADIRDRNLRNYHANRADTRAWTAIVHARGWSAPNWPVDKGGTGWSAMQQFIFDEENFAAGAPLLETGGLKMIGPVIYTFGTPGQHERYNIPFLRGEISWGQGFSEPGAGSDLAGLTTRADREGDDYVINGHKMWTTNGHYANWLYLLVRTDQTQKQRGISLILVPADAPGVTIRPIIEDAAFAARLVQLESDLDALTWMTLRALARQGDATWQLPVGSILKVRGTELQQKIGEMHIEALGDRGAYVYPEPDFATGEHHWPPGPDYAPGLLADALYRRAVTIYGGSNEIQRTIIAKQYLGL